MRIDLHGKVVTITGAAQGLGEATAYGIAEAGGKVVLSDILPEGEKVAKTIRDKGGEAVFIRVDVTKPDDCQKLVDKAVSEFGRLDCAANNAGFHINCFKIHTCSDNDWVSQRAVNLDGIFYCMRAELNQMVKQGQGGSILNWSSIGGLVGLIHAPAYCAFKHGVIGLTKAAAVEYAENMIRINAICPGVVQTQMMQALIDTGTYTHEQMASMVPQNRIAPASEIAAAAVYLLSDAAMSITGIAFPADAGYTAR